MRYETQVTSLKDFTAKHFFYKQTLLNIPDEFEVTFIIISPPLEDPIDRSGVIHATGLYDH